MLPFACLIAFVMLLVNQFFSRSGVPGSALRAFTWITAAIPSASRPPVPGRQHPDAVVRGEKRSQAFPTMQQKRGWIPQLLAHAQRQLEGAKRPARP